MVGCGCHPVVSLLNTEPVELTLEQLEFTEGHEQVAGPGRAAICPADFEAETVDYDPAACFDMAFSFDTTLHRFSAPIPIDTETQAAGAAATSDSGATPDEPAADSGSGSATLEVLGDVIATLGGEERESLNIARRIQDFVGASRGRYSTPYAHLRLPYIAPTAALFRCIRAGKVQNRPNPPKVAVPVTDSPAIPSIRKPFRYKIG